MSTVERRREPKSTMFNVGVNPANPAQIYCCTSDGEVFGTQDGGDSWGSYLLPESAREVGALACG